jgi:hypothetical protein
VRARGLGSRDFFFFLTITIRPDVVAFACKFPATTCLISENDSDVRGEAVGSTSPGAFSTLWEREVLRSKPNAQPTCLFRFLGFFQWKAPKSLNKEALSRVA